MACVILVNRVVVECLGRNPCWVGERGMCTLILFRSSLSTILETVLSRVIGRYDASSVGGLFGFRIVMILACCFLVGILSPVAIASWVGETPLLELVISVRVLYSFLILLEWFSDCRYCSQFLVCSAWILLFISSLSAFICSVMFSSFSVSMSKIAKIFSS